MCLGVDWILPHIGASNVRDKDTALAINENLNLIPFSAQFSAMRSYPRPPKYKLMQSLRTVEAALLACEVMHMDQEVSHK